MIGKWITALLDYDRDTEFTGDDADRFSALIDLKGTFDKVEVQIPALSSSGVVSIYRQADDSTATVPVQCIALSATAAGHFIPSTTSGAGGISVVFPVGPIQYLRVHVAADQAANRTFIVRGC